MSDGIPQRFPQQPRSYFGFGERRPSPRSSGGTQTCETCQQPVDPILYNRCRGCNQYAHGECHETMSIGVTWRTEMCVCCTDYVRRLLRIVRAMEARRFSNWQAEVWFKAVVEASNGERPMPEANYDALSTLQNYFSNAISSGLRVYQSHSLATPTERGDPPSPIGALLPAPAKPISPGLPTPKAVSVDASAEQGGEDPPRSSLLFPSQEIGSRQRSDVPVNGVMFQLIRERRQVLDLYK